MAVYTKTGDKGSTKLVGGVKVRKHHPRVEAYGTTDELCSLLGHSLSFLSSEDYKYKEELINIQQLIFDCSRDLAVPERGMRPYKLTSDSYKWLEKKIDAYWKLCPEINKFILPGGTLFASSLQVVRTVTRRAERCVVFLMDEGEDVNSEVLVFLNRLSDYLFVLARLVNFQSGELELDYENSPQVFSRRKKSVPDNS
ncbi:cob(I)yrinic acid a,c-diamide adenosyltransferase [Vagococcus hydrophili]|uniref:Corrinoid adenosyltransferase n=1 Tax=Vagococcus hydrophili TaxID=2714947 RepID=A0A6G8AUH7_9ENTE|nr:cob(I)yrinic acid a,c-diamide adenosyltransferase [Vagococcus hydrophili]QIL48656.1 cob(I)yrinic acid a,c-diamide adenosyltransferase [Vagococcus hydrophili]